MAFISNLCNSRLQSYYIFLTYANLQALISHNSPFLGNSTDFPGVWKIFGKKSEKVCNGSNLLQNKLFLKKNVEKLVYMKKSSTFAADFQSVGIESKPGQNRVTIFPAKQTKSINNCLNQQ